MIVKISQWYYSTITSIYLVVEIGGLLMIILIILKELCVPTKATLAQLNSLLLTCPVTQFASLHQVNIIISTIIVHYPLCHLHHHSQYYHHSLYTPQKRAEKLMSEKKFSLAKVDYQCAIDTKGKKKSFLVQKHMIWGRKRGIPLYNIVSIIQREPSTNSWLWVLLCWWSLLLCVLKALLVLEISHASCFLYV